VNGILAGLLILVAVSALGVVFSPQTIYSALSLVLTVGLLAVIFLVLDAQFLFAVQLIVYAGAVMVLFVFIIALLDPTSEDRPRLTDPRFALGVLAVAGICAAVFIAARSGVPYYTSCPGGAQQAACMHGFAVGSSAVSGDPRSDPYHTFGFPAEGVDQAGNVQTVANQLFRTFVLPFEVTSALLLVAAIGAVYLTRRTGRPAVVRAAERPRPARELPEEAAEEPVRAGVG
jgi:NADH-quinone oxidoreductase subunit J